MSYGQSSPFFSSSFVLLLLCVSCCGCADSAKVVAYLQVQDSASSSLPSSLWPDRPDNELKVLVATQCALLESEFVLKSALSRRDIRELDVVVEQNHSETWLKRILRVHNPPDTSIIMISLKGRQEDADQLKIILDAIIAAYQTEVVAADRISQQSAYSGLRESFLVLSKDLTREIELRSALENSDDAEKAGKIHVQNLQIAAMEQVVRELEMSLIKQKLHEQISPERVKVMQSAFVESGP